MSLGLHHLAVVTADLARSEAFYAGVLGLPVIRRHDDAGAAAGRFALPGGFVQPGETPAAAAARELREETGLSLPADVLVPITIVEGGGRDPRDTDERWVRSHVFAARVDHDVLVRGGSDAAAAVFVDVRLRPALAFDHDVLVERARDVLGR